MPATTDLSMQVRSQKKKKKIGRMDRTRQDTHGDRIMIRIILAILAAAYGLSADDSLNSCTCGQGATQFEVYGRFFPEDLCLLSNNHGGIR
jgi:hypothetical protein